VSGDLSGEYGIAHLKDLLAEDSRTNELDIHCEKSGQTILLRGEVSMSDRRAAVEAIARECFPSCRIENQIRVRTLSEPTEAEEVG
jgi:hypothetical protein